MTSPESAGGIAQVSVENIGGIQEASVELKEGTNILVGRNATNRTSFLRAIMAALGSDQASIKGDADEAEAHLQYGDEQFQRNFSRRNEMVSKTGNPYLDDPILADLFAFLLESNEARRTVATEGNLRDIIMRPVDLQAINADIAELEERRRQIDEQIEMIEAKKEDLPELDSRKKELEDQISEAQSKLEAKESEIEAADADVESRQEEKEELETKLEELNETRSDLDDVRYKIQSSRESIQSLKDERSSLTEQLDSLSVPEQSEIEDLNARIKQFREQRREIDGQLNTLQSTIQFNEDMLEGERSEFTDQLNEQSEIADNLLPEDEITCWTCGSEVKRERIESTIGGLKSLRQEKISDKNEVSTTIDELQDEKGSLNEDKQQKENLQRQLANCEDELERRNDRLEELQDQRTNLEATVQDAEEDVENLESGQFDEILDLHREANELEFELGKYQNELESVEAKIDDIEGELSELPDLRSEREETNQELTNLRSRVKQLEEQAISQFNEHMSEILDRFNYTNLDRIWIESIQKEVRNGREKNMETFFEIHVIRATSGGTTYEDTLDHLSESEREVTGIVFALAGYLAHDVHEKVPFMLLDSLEAIDAARIAELIDYFSEFPDYLVVALLPEDAEALSEKYNRVTQI